MRTAVADDDDDRRAVVARMSNIFGEVLRRLPPELRAAAEEAAREGAERAAAAQQRGEPPPDSAADPDGTTAEQLMLAERRRRRVVALRSFLPDGRAEAAMRGLACLHPDQHPAAIAKWLADPDKLTLILAGTVGPGKTMAAYAAAAEAAIHSGAAMRSRTGRVEVRQVLARGWTVNGYLAELRPDGSPDPVWALRDRARTAELLILDDFGAELDAESTEFVRRELVELLDWRAEWRLRTIVTTNLPSRVIHGQFGDRLMSRLVDRATALTFVGPDRRQLQHLEWGGPG